MSLFFILFIFFILHVQFLFRHIYMGLDEAHFFQFTLKYQFSDDVAMASLLFSLLCGVSFVIGYKLFSRKKKYFLKWPDIYSKVTCRELFILNSVGIISIVYMLYIVIFGNFNYTTMTLLREKSNFVFELRMIFLLLLSHILLNIPWRHLLSMREFSFTRKVVFLYALCLLPFQARSALFELAGLIAFTQLMWHSDKIKIKYMIVVVGAMLVPNLMVLGRLGVPDNFSDLIAGLFSFEYSMLINNFLSAAIDAGSNMLHEISFLPTLKLLIPSPLRDVLGIIVVKDNYYLELSDLAGIKGGGFSLLAEMYSNFAWFSSIVFALLGMCIGFLNSKCIKVGRVSVFGAIGPLVYVAFILAFRNDFGVFLKYLIQLFFISWFVMIILLVRFDASSGKWLLLGMSKIFSKKNESFK